MSTESGAFAASDTAAAAPARGSAVATRGGRAAAKRDRPVWLQQPRMLIGALAAASAVTAVATPLGSVLPLVGAPIVALAIGMAIATIVPSAKMQRELAFLSRYVLQTAIVLLGATIDLSAVLRVGVGSLPVMLSSLSAALLTSIFVGRALSVPSRLRVLLGVGTGICGASAVAAVSGVVDANEKELSYAISTIFVFNLIAVLTFIPVAHLLGMGQHQFGLWDGTAVNDVSSVVAAGFAYGHSAGTFALIVKLTRTTMIIPVTLVLAQLAARARRRSAATAAGSGTTAAGLRSAAGDVGDDPAARMRVTKLIPWFLLWFLLASAADTLGVWGSGARTSFSAAGLLLTTVALAAVGLSSDLREARRTGGRPLLLGASVWIAVTLVSLGMQQIVGA